jgi:hypothetical protein
MLITKVAHHFKSCRPIFLFNFFGALEGINLVAKTFFKFKFENLKKLPPRFWLGPR